MRDDILPKLVIVRHGQSLANASNTFTGWNDVDLSEKGIEQAKHAAHLLDGQDFWPTMVHTSVLMRAIKTANIIMEENNWLYLPQQKTWRLNERHYGALRGINKDQARIDFGAEQVRKWRRDFNEVPPLLPKADTDCRYAQLDARSIPRGESLAMSYGRIIAYYLDQIAPHLRRGEDQLVVAHGSSLRLLVKFLEDVSDKDSSEIEILNAEPIIYELDDNLNIVSKTVL